MNRKVLLVDDLEPNRMILRNMLSGCYDVIEAADGVEALAILRLEGNQISAMLLDIFMPAMDGFETLRRVRDNLQLSQLPVIMITSSDDEASRIRALSQGASDYVTKPYNREIILHCLRNHIAFYEATETVKALKRDSLTGLYTRESFFDKAREMVSEHDSGYYVMACFDIDKFKVINDQYGTAKGDDVLRHVGKTFREGFHLNGGICSRVAADDFAVLYPSSFVDSDELVMIWENATHVDGIIFPLTFSIGRYIVDDKTMAPSAMFDRAMLAASSVKGRFGNRAAFYTEAMRQRIIHEQRIVLDMMPALKERQFETWFQPQYNHATGARIGAEALVRWRHPEKGLIPPDQFIPAFEQNGFVYELDKFIWGEVCRYLRKWLDEGRNPLPISVNVSRNDVLRPELLEVITGLLNKYSLPMELLRLEVTESAFSQETERITAAVAGLVNAGFTVEIDDFGSGYSSLNTLKDVPAQILKLDMKFFDKRDNTERGGNIVESIVRMAKWLGMSVIAEGVEHIKQADFLSSIGCNYIQGYLYARPMPAAEYEEHCRGKGKEEHLLALETVENLDNNSFWDPESMDTLIFNSYVGAATIFELHDGEIELIRATEMFAKILSDTMTVDQALRIDWTKHLSRESLRSILEAAAKSAASKMPVTGEIVFIDLPGCPHKTYLRSSMRVIAVAGDRQLVYGINENITSQRQAERKIVETDKQIRFLNEMSHELLAQPDTDMGIKSLLKRLLEYFQGNRAYIFEFSADLETLSNTYEICAPGVTAEIENLQKLPRSTVSAWESSFAQRGYIIIEDVNALDPGRSEERGIIEAQGISSLFAAPLSRDGKLIGIIGIDDPKRRLEQMNRFVTLGDYVAVMLTRRDLNAKIQSDRRSMQALMDDTPGGFARMQLMPDGRVRTLFVNRRTCELRKMSEEELMTAEGEDAMVNVHPDDVQDILEKMRAMIAKGGTQQLKYRLRGGDGVFIWFEVFVRMTRSENKNVFLNLYYADLSEEEKKRLTVQETMPFILSAIMKSSPNLDFAKDKDFNYICCSPAFVRFTRQKTEADVIGKTDYDFWTKDVADRFRGDDEKLFDTGESLVDYTEPIPSDDGIQHYSVTSKYILRDSAGEIIGLYGSGRDVTDVRSAYDQLKLLTDSIPGGIAKYVLWHNEVRTIYFNDGFCKMLGCTREEYTQALQQGTTSRIFPEDLPELDAQIHAMYETGAPVNCVFRAHKVKGEGFVWINFRGEVAERTGGACYANAVLFDMTAQYEAIQKEKQATQRMQSVMDSVISGICATVVKGESVEYLFTNDRYYEIHGYTRAQFAAEVGNVFDLFWPEDRERVREAANRVNRSRKPLTLEYRIIRRDKEIRWVRATISVHSFDDVDGPVQVTVVRDINDEKQADIMLQTLNDKLHSPLPK